MPAVRQLSLPNEPAGASQPYHQVLGTPASSPFSLPLPITLPLMLIPICKNQPLRRNSNRRRPRRLRGIGSSRAVRRAHRPHHAAARQPGHLQLQPFLRRHRQGDHTPGDRRPRRAGGTRHRQGRRAVQGPQPEEGTRRLGT